MNMHTMMIEAGLKTQELKEQAHQARLARQAQQRKPRRFFETAVCLAAACRAGWAAFRDSLRATHSAGV